MLSFLMDIRTIARTFLCLGAFEPSGSVSLVNLFRISFRSTFRASVNSSSESTKISVTCFERVCAWEDMAVGGANESLKTNLVLFQAIWAVPQLDRSLCAGRTGTLHRGGRSLGLSREQDYIY